MANDTPEQVAARDKAYAQRSVEVSASADSFDKKIHSVIEERDAKHEALRAEQNGNVALPVAPEKDGNFLDVSTDAFSPNKPWLQHEDFPGGADAAQAKKDAGDAADRKADRDAVVAARKAEAAIKPLPPVSSNR